MIAGFAVTAGVAGGQLEPYSPERMIAVTCVVSVAAFVLTLLGVLLLLLGGLLSGTAALLDLAVEGLGQAGLHALGGVLAGEDGPAELEVLGQGVGLGHVEARRFGEGAAILVGDFAFVYADMLFATAPPEARPLFDELRKSEEGLKHLDEPSLKLTGTLFDMLITKGMSKVVEELEAGKQTEETK